MSQDLISTEDRLREYRAAFDRLEEITAQLDKQIDNDISFLRQTDEMTSKAFAVLDHTEKETEKNPLQKIGEENLFAARSLKPWSWKLYYI